MFSLAYDDRCEIAAPGHQQSRGPRMQRIMSIGCLRSDLLLFAAAPKQSEC